MYSKTEIAKEKIERRHLIPKVTLWTKILMHGVSVNHSKIIEPQNNLHSIETLKNCSFSVHDFSIHHYKEEDWSNLEWGVGVENNLSE